MESILNRWNELFHRKAVDCEGTHTIPRFREQIGRQMDLHELICGFI